MFGGGIWGSYVGSDDHLTKEREAPPRPIELEFPEYIPLTNDHALTPELSRQIRCKIAHTRTFSSISDSDLEQLNIHFEPNVPLSSLVPQDSFKSRPLLYDDDLQSMLDEISISNRDAFREVLRLQPLEGQIRPRLAYARNFFASLEDMSRYFDTSYDEYYRIPGDRTSSEDAKTPNSISHDSRDDGPDGTKEVYKGYRLSNAEAMNPGARIAMTKNLLKMVMHKFQCRDHEPIPNPREKLTIRGVKLQAVQYQFCVARIPPEIKQARARLVEGPLMAVHSRDELRFKVKDRLFTPEKTAFVGERFDLFREIGCMLVLAMQRSRGAQDSIPQPEKPDSWWVTKERWGGGPVKWGQLPFEIFEDEDPSLSPQERMLRDDKQKQDEEDRQKLAEASSVGEQDSVMVDALMADSNKGLPSIIPEHPQSRRKKPRGTSNEEVEIRDGRKVMNVPPGRRKWYRDWQQLRANSSGLDEKIISRKVGNEDEGNSGFDQIFLLTSCNHHVAISKLRVHRDYLAWLQNGTAVGKGDGKDNNPNVLYAKRSIWYNMLDIEARKEFLIELWRLMCWMNRDEIPQSEYEKMQEKQKSKTDQDSEPAEI